MDRTMTVAADSSLARWRADTPSCERLVHLNNAGAALVPRVVRDAIAAHLDLEERLGGYEAAEDQRETIRDAYDGVARLLGAKGRNMAFVQNSTIAFAQAISAFDFKPGDVVLTSRADYASNQIMCLSLRRTRPRAVSTSRRRAV
jgi:cysteine desulfurase/selenocysteine lyase